ncbi:response regulator transcription factor [Amphibacillus sp. Q70]|uniref:response regulator transcription factor n=1 Tax=Amphibacillus sp. Q70 TaxID=3453416 RepID=UPI003F85508A
MINTYKILIVDDEMLIRQGIIKFIDWEKEGFQIIGEAANGQEALDMIKQTPPHIMITDVVMPIMDGVELVKKVKELYSDIEILVLSSFEDFEYVRSTFQNGVVDYILKPKLNSEDLLKTLNKIVGRKSGSTIKAPHKSIAIEDIMKRLMQGYDVDDNQNIIKEKFPYHNYSLLKLCIRHGERYSLNWDTIIEKLTTYFIDIHSAIIIKEKSAVTLLLNFESSKSTYIKRKLKEIALGHFLTQPKMIWLLSKEFDSINHIKSVYEDHLLKIQQYLFYFPDTHLLIEDELPAEKSNTQEFDLNHFIELFKDRQFNISLEYMENHVNCLASQYTKDSFEFTSLLGNIIFNMLVTLRNLKYDISELEKKKYNFLKNLTEALDVHTAINYFNLFLDEIKALIFSNKENHEQANMQKILTYIAEHYKESLSLTELADHFHFNPSYLSFYFTNHHDEGFSEYLNRIRIKKSMELLEYSSESISTISEKVGYSEHSYFSKVFKKITGMSPSRYRREYGYHNEKSF